MLNASVFNPLIKLKQSNGDNVEPIELCKNAYSSLNAASFVIINPASMRSEERRVGRECRSQGPTGHRRKRRKSAGETSRDEAQGCVTRREQRTTRDLIRIQ